MTTPTQPPADEKLMPCPFCGHPPERATYDRGTCGCEYHKCPLYRLKTTVEAWNLRTTPPTAPAEDWQAKHSKLQRDVWDTFVACWKAMGHTEIPDPWSGDGPDELPPHLSSFLSDDIRKIISERDGFMAQLAEARIQVERLEGELKDLTEVHAASIGQEKVACDAAEKFRSERDAALAELAKTQSHLKHNEEVYVRLEKELRAELAAVRAGVVTEEMADAAREAYRQELWQQMKKDDESADWDEKVDRACMRAALQAVVGSGWIKCSEVMPQVDSVPYYRDSFSVPVMLPVHRNKLFRWYFPTGGWVEAGWSDGCRPSDYEDWNLESVTHWRPLPPPPGEGE